MTRVVNLTPTWTEAARMYAVIVESGGETARAGIVPDILRMGELIDRLQARPMIDWINRGSLTRSQALVAFQVHNVRYAAVLDFTQVRLLKVTGEVDGVLQGEVA